MIGNFFKHDDRTVSVLIDRAYPIVKAVYEHLKDIEIILKDMDTLKYLVAHEDKYVKAGEIAKVIDPIAQNLEEILKTVEYSNKSKIFADDSKKYSEKSKAWATTLEVPVEDGLYSSRHYATEAGKSAEEAQKAETKAEDSAYQAGEHVKNARIQLDLATNQAGLAKASASAAQIAEDGALTFSRNAKHSELSAEEAAGRAKESEINAGKYAKNAEDAASRSQANEASTERATKRASEYANKAFTYRNEIIASYEKIEGLNQKANENFKKALQASNNGQEYADQALASKNAAKVSETKAKASEVATQAMKNAVAGEARIINERLTALSSPSVSVTTLAPGSQGSATVNLAGNSYDWHFNIPQGLKGDRGPRGEKGDPLRFEDLTEEQKKSLNLTLPADVIREEKLTEAINAVKTEASNTYATKTELSTKADQESISSLTSNIGRLDRKDKELETTIATLATKTELSDYATKDFVNKEWGARTTQAEGAIKALQASVAAFPATYATKSEVSAVDGKFADYAKTASLRAYAKKAEVESTYATKAELKEVSAKAGSGGDVDLSGYVSKEDLTTKLRAYAKTADLAAKADKFTNDADHKKFNTAIADLKNEDSTIKASLGDYAKTADVDKKLGSYVTRSSLTTTLQYYATTTDLLPYVEKEYLNREIDTVLRDLNNKADVSALNSKANSSDLNNYVQKEGDRGVLKGYSRQEHRVQNGGTLTIDINSPDDLSVDIKGDVTVKFTKPVDGQVGTKVIHFWTTGTATIKWQNCTWSGGNAPTYGNPSKVLIVVARFSGDWTYTSAFVNTQG